MAGKINSRCLSAAVLNKVSLNIPPMGPLLSQCVTRSYKREITSHSPNLTYMKESFLNITDHNDLATFFGLSYKELSKILYKTNDAYKYNEFLIPKKTGGHRKIRSPNKKIKNIQRQLSDVLYDIYPGKPSAHGFIKNKDILSNSKKHLDKNYVFNIDLKDFFSSIHFGRVRNLFKASPFNFNNSTATILAQICCFHNCLPQGAPTSPILSNMVAWKLDGQLQHLAKVTNSTYTRYVDDITFSFTCSRKRLPKELIIFEDDIACPGHKLSHIIVENGFAINFDKVRLAGSNQRMEVTGITVNQFPNVSRKYIRQLHSILNAWRKYGYDATETEFNNKFSHCHRPSKSPKSLKYVIKGKLSFLRNIRGGRDPIFNKLANQFNELVGDTHLKFKIFKETEPVKIACNSLWVIQSCYDDESGDCKVAQGTGFSLKDFGIITCAHVVSEHKSDVFQEIKALKCFDSTKEYDLKVQFIDHHRDIAICSITNTTMNGIPDTAIELSEKSIEPGLEALLLGFPAHKVGQSHYVVDTKVASTFPWHGVQKFEIGTLIREGNSGGPIIDLDGRLLGIALEGASKESGNNAALHYLELEKVKAEEFKI